METLASTGIDFQGTEIPFVTSSSPFLQECVGVDPSAFGFSCRIDGRFIKTLIKDIVEHNGVHYRRS